MLPAGTQVWIESARDQGWQKVQLTLISIAELQRLTRRVKAAGA